MTRQSFVARERELSQLQTFLARALEGKGQVVFVAGEAGSGKTALLREFARASQDVHTDLVVAVGECNAQTGIGDPYLPFREILALLTGDVEAKLAQGAITGENAKRLGALLRFSGQALVEVGPVLINTFVPGTTLMTMAARFLAGKAGWLKPLQQLNERKEPSPSGGGQEQDHVFEQYANVLKALAAKQPVILVLDDLHWADTASTSLLFYLGRRINESRILIVGAYRPEEVALGRADERHPLEKVLTEFKRYFGNIVLDLGQVGETEARHFVDAYLDTEPTRLGTEFREALFKHTGGHALFVVEVLRMLQERGDLVQDAEGRWLAGQSLTWATLPVRVEGVIQERLERLDQVQHELLRVASVEGMDFTAEVVAVLQQMQLRLVLKELSQNLDKRHRLVHEIGELTLGTQRLAAYKFTHALIHQCLYGELGASERRLLHNEVARNLEQLYAEKANEIAPQLARHYREAGDDEKTFAYSITAGDAAARIYAHTEASALYSQASEALARLPETEEHRRASVDTLLRQASVAFFYEPLEQQLERLVKAELLAGELPSADGKPGGDRLRRARVQYWIGRTYANANNMPKAIGYFRQVLAFAQAEGGDEHLRTIPSIEIGRVLVMQGRLGQGDALLTQALPLLERASDFHEWVLGAILLAAARAIRGDYSEGLKSGNEALQQAVQMEYPTGIALAHCALSIVHLLGGDAVRSLEHGRAALDIVAASGESGYLYFGLGAVAWAYSRLGNHAAASESMARSRLVAQHLGTAVAFSDLFAAVDAELALNAGQTDHALTLADKAVSFAKSTGGIWAEGLAHRVWAQSLAKLNASDWSQAQEHFAESVRLFAEGDVRIEAAHTHLEWGQVLRERGEAESAREHFGIAGAQYEASGLKQQLEETRRLLADLRT